MEPRAEIRRRTRLSPEARRNQLMECAIEVFSRRGIGRAGHAEIAEQAKVSVATVFNYFNTREELVDEVLAEIERFVNLTLSQAYSGNGSIFDKIKRHVSLSVDAAYDQPDYAGIWLEWSSSVREEVWPRYTRLLDQCLELIASELQTAMDAGEITSVLSAQDLARSLTGFGYVMMQMINQPQRPAREEVTDFLFKYVTAPIQAC
ncbi:TetR/AcrR family transcriptional regulator [Aeromonas jandaei]|jgi:TetR/AcrR family hemagglutinin/protease transcriptional regulator|uniref:TetR/AcrR family transcriptional regulator n=2 Tax=Aeromonas TaxID=642 RepID=A0ABX6ZJ68_AERJA|nr:MULTISPECIES: TetR/AcrR family transcriptional regulator [Aeromonas]MBL0545975.1 TetR/AcrR family transcriptional regulator [Aeromonas jandaei]MBL0598620.1 TetR/AcrR family transcriptional regulator [Aeromonas jandaei]MBL0626803.1 TetR/AcrR family transcriptional regulator [Aeromonas jandaei]MBL0667549.1 TetR/AcrR family transcriptional regulator [Aeromonas jandaei]MBM0493144.1 TetR/AcrR family transcriptional regulator [Aeromonas jandaei]